MTSQVENEREGRENTLFAIAFSLPRWPLFLMLASYFLFAHGCHGDEDHELFARLSATCRAAHGVERR